MRQLIVFKDLVRFALHEGVVLNAAVVDALLNGLAADDENTSWHYMEVLMNSMEEMLISNKLPAHTAALYQLWQQELA
ncbi:hypothetical protein [Hymenobacter sp. CRA2]|uniref:hypothetical protein n=1 Tax=Hymenobacter sp. CRA2 TaxID=1955620 RepID=UPI00098EB238|nr:hypothetical protein [Hymenobacter sp. CRA2]OON66881.1 hypothetical protein B0919_21210 [Hymenobacter sp. CRA2]